MTFRISVRTNVRQVAPKLNAVAKKQVPFATALALNALGRLVVAGEKRGFQETFDRPTPFTVNSVRMRSARKDNPRVVVFVMDIAAKYLEPYERRGLHHMTARALLTPIKVGLNRYGNIPRKRVAQLKGQASVFIGGVKLKRGGEVHGVWRRIKGTKKRPGRLQLLVKFSDPKPVTQSLRFHERAKAIVDANFNREFGHALSRALATARK